MINTEFFVEAKGTTLPKIAETPPPLYMINMIFWNIRGVKELEKSSYLTETAKEEQQKLL